MHTAILCLIVFGVLPFLFHLIDMLFLRIRLRIILRTEEKLAKLKSTDL